MLCELRPVPLWVLCDVTRVLSRVYGLGAAAVVRSHRNTVVLGWRFEQLLACLRLRQRQDDIVLDASQGSTIFP